MPPERFYDDVLQLWKQTKTGYTPTLIVGYGGNWGENYWYMKTNVWEDERLTTFVPRRILDARSRRRVMVPENEHNHFNNARIAKELFDKGVSIQLGAHGQREGLAAHWEIWMFQQGGMTPLQALRAATTVAADLIEVDDRGRLAPGLYADVIAVPGNPLEDITRTEQVVFVMKGGQVARDDVAGASTGG